jgi:hypothetical protein
MSRSGFPSALILSLVACLFLAPSLTLGDAKQKPKAAKPAAKPKSAPKSTSKPKNTTPSRTVHGASRSVHAAHTNSSATHVTHTAAAVRRPMQHYYAGKAPRSLTWYRHHQRRHWVYEVRIRSRAWSARALPTPQAAKTFSSYLRHHSFQTYTRHANNAWVVHYRSLHSHRYGMYRSLGVARRVETSLRRNGLVAWLKYRRMYF